VGRRDYAKPSNRRLASPPPGPPPALTVALERERPCQDENEQRDEEAVQRCRQTARSAKELRVVATCEQQERQAVRRLRKTCHVTVSAEAAPTAGALPHPRRLAARTPSRPPSWNRPRREKGPVAEGEGDQDAALGRARGPRGHAPPRDRSPLRGPVASNRTTGRSPFPPNHESPTPRESTMRAPKARPVSTAKESGCSRSGRLRRRARPCSSRQRRPCSAAGMFGSRRRAKEAGLRSGSSSA